MKDLKFLNIKIKRKLNLLIITSLFALNVNSQILEPMFLNKVNQHSLSAEFAALSYSYAHNFKPNAIFGARIQAGYGFQIMLASTTILFDFGSGNGPEEIKPSGGSFELLKLQFFYRNAISNSFYFDVGPVASLEISEDEWGNPYNVGIEASAYYVLWKIYLGLRIKGAMSFDTHNPDGIKSDKTYFALYATPFVIGINF